MSSKKQNTNATSTSNTSGTDSGTNVSAAQTGVNVPDWLLNPAQSLAAGDTALGGQGSSAFAPQMSATQQDAIGQAGRFTQGGWGWGQAATAANGVPNVSAGTPISAGQIQAGAVGADQVHAGSVLDGLGAYFNPYASSVISPTMQALEQQFGQQDAQLESRGAGSGAFNGSRFGVAEGVQSGQQALAAGQTMGGLLNGMYGQATSLSAADKDRSLQAGEANQSANLDAARANQSAGLTAAQANQSAGLDAARANQSAGLTAAQANQSAALQKAGLLNTIANDSSAGWRQNVGLADQLGQQQTDQGNAARQYPIQFQQQLTGLLSGLNPSSYFGKTINSADAYNGVTNSANNTNSSSTTTSTPSLFDTLGKAAQIAALFGGG